MSPGSTWLRQVEMAARKTRSLTLAEAYDRALDCYRRGDLAKAETVCRRIVEASPGHVDARHMLGAISAQRNRPQEAMAHLNAVLALAPDHADAHSSLAAVLQALDRADEAIRSFRTALRLKPDNADTHYNLGTLLQLENRHGEAIESFRHAIAIRPDFAEAHHNCAHSLLAMGDFEAGWREYEWRWQTRDFATDQPNLAAPPWDGTPLADRTILVHAEQGIGDVLQFCRYIPLLRRAYPEAGILFALYGRLTPTMRTSFGDGIDFLPYRDLMDGRLPSVDVHAPLMSLPRMLGTTVDTIPAEIPYLVPAAPLPTPSKDRFVVGLSWYTSNARTGAQRRIPLADFGPLAAVPGVGFVSLQYGETDAERRAAADDLGLVVDAETGEDFIADLTAFAARVAACDLVISIDNSTVHMAGALGRPVWTLLPAAADWRWMLERDDSPWYPTMRLFRQSRRGRWDDVIGGVRDALAETVATSRA